MDDKEPRIVKERYQLLGVLGKGGWGTVYKGLDLTTAQVVAVKQVPLAGIPPDALQAIMTEITLLQKLQHPNIVRYIDSLKTERYLLIVLEFVENGSLADITKQVGRFPEPLIVIYISQVLAGLAYLHEQGVIHRDIKGANILSTKDGNVKVADFGVATAAGDKEHTMGSPYWMAPEIIELNGASAKSDIWSVGCTIVELLTGKPPYYELDQMPALFRIVQDDCPPLPAGISPLCRDFLMQCFQKEPLLRQDAMQLLKHRWITARGGQTEENAVHAEDTKDQVRTFNMLRTKTIMELKAEGKQPEVHKPKHSRKKEKEKERDKDRSGENKSSGRSLLPFGMGRRKGHARKKSTSKDSRTHHNEGKKKHHIRSKSSANLEPGKSADESKRSGTLRFFSFSPRPFGGSKQRQSPLVTSTPSKKREEKDESSSASDWDDDAPASSTSPTAAPAPRLDSPRGESNSSGSDWDEPTVPERRQVTQLESSNMSSRSVEVEADSWEEDDDDESEAARIAQLRSRSAQPARSQATLGTDVRSLEFYSNPLAPHQSQRIAKLEAYQESEIDNDDWDDALDDALSSEDDHGTSLAARLRSKLQQRGVTESEDSRDDFLDEDSASSSMDEFDMEENLRKDHLQEVQAQMVRELSSLTLNTSSDSSAQLETCRRLVGLLREYPAQRSVLLKSQGVMPLFELIELMRHTPVLEAALEVVLAALDGQKAVQESLLVLGAIPILVAFWEFIGSSRSSPAVILLTVQIFRSLMDTAGEELVVRHFIACRSLPAVNGLFEVGLSEAESSRDSVLLFGVELVCKVLLSSTSLGLKKNDLCRIWARSGLLPLLARTLDLLFKHQSDSRLLSAAQVADCVLVFARGDSVVKQLICEHGVLAPLLEGLSCAPASHQLALVKCLHMVSMDSRCLAALQSAAVIERLVSLLQKRSAEDSRTQYVLMTLFNLCRLSPARQLIAVECGIVPHLQHVVVQNSTSKQFALPLLCEVARTRAVLPVLAENNGIEFYVALFSQRYPWQVQALEALAAWLAAEPDRVSKELSEIHRATAITDLFAHAQDDAFVNLLEPLLKIVQLSPSVARELVTTGFISHLRERLSHPNALVRVTLLKILKATYEAHDPKSRISMVRGNGLLECVKRLGSDRAVLVSEMAAQLRDAFEH